MGEWMTEERWEQLRLCAHRIEGLATDVAEAHQLGIPSGEHHQPWSLDFQQQAVMVYFETLPADYERLVASVFAESSEMMTATTSPDRITDDWGVVAEYLDSVATAIRCHPAYAAESVRSGSDQLGDQTPALMRYDELAKLVHPQGLERLREAASRVEAWCGLRAAGITEEEQTWLSSLAVGMHVVDMATEHGLSERSLYRSLAALWKRLGVDNRQQAVALAAERGWIDSTS